MAVLTRFCNFSLVSRSVPLQMSSRKLSLSSRLASSYVSSAPGGIVIDAGARTKCLTIWMNCSASACVSIFAGSQLGEDSIRSHDSLGSDCVPHSRFTTISTKEVNPKVQPKTKPRSLHFAGTDEYAHPHTIQNLEQAGMPVSKLTSPGSSTSAGFAHPALPGSLRWRRPASRGGRRWFASRF